MDEACRALYVVWGVARCLAKRQVGPPIAITMGVEETPSLWIFRNRYSLAGLKPANHHFGLPPSDKKLKFQSISQGRPETEHAGSIRNLLWLRCGLNWLGGLFDYHQVEETPATYPSRISGQVSRGGAEYQLGASHPATAKHNPLHQTQIQWYLHIRVRPPWNKSNLIYVLFGREKILFGIRLAYVKMSHPNKAQTSRNSIVWNDQTMSHFRNIPRRRQKQSYLDRFLVNVKPGDSQPGPSRE
jgi:hypothetical protein